MRSTPFLLAVSLVALCVAAPARSFAQEKPTGFAKVELSATDAKLTPPSGAQTWQIVQTSTDKPGQAVMLHLYQLNNAVFVDLYTAQNNTAPIRQNRMRLPASRFSKDAPMSFSLTRFVPLKKRGWLLIGETPSTSIACVLPKGFGAVAYVQEFPRANAKSTLRSFAFDQSDSRGFVIVKASLESAGAVQPGANDIFFVWDGKKYIRRTTSPEEKTIGVR